MNETEEVFEEGWFDGDFESLKDCDWIETGVGMLPRMIFEGMEEWPADTKILIVRLPAGSSA